MPIPDFSDDYHMPDGEHKCTLEEIEQKLLTTDKRIEVWKLFRFFLDRLTQLNIKPEYVYINGSFVTGRKEPGDVDFAALIKPGKMLRAIKAAEPHDKKAIETFCDSMKAEELRNIMGAHMLIAHNDTLMDQWAKFFRFGKGGSLREPDPSRDPISVQKPKTKGILRVDL